MPEGLKITMNAMSEGLTRDLAGRPLLQAPFVFQCPPLEEFKIVHQFTFGNYDTLLMGQYARRGSRQLLTWQFDTLIMTVGQKSEFDPSQTPGWVPFQSYDSGDPIPLESYVEELTTLHDAGAPFVLTAHFAYASNPALDAGLEVTPLLHTPAVLTGFTEGYKHGEDDAIYLEGCTFSEWRDPSIADKELGTGDGRAGQTPPTTVKLMPDGVCVTKAGDKIPAQSGGLKKTTLTNLSKYFYHDTTKWRSIARANHLRGGSGSDPLTFWYKKIPKTGKTIKIPDLAAPKFKKTHPEPKSSGK